MRKKNKSILIFITTLAGLMTSLGIVFYFLDKFYQNDTIRKFMVLIVMLWILLSVWIFILVLLPIVRSWSKQISFGSSEYYMKQIQKNKLEKKLSKLISILFILISVTLTIYSFIYLSSLNLNGFWSYVGYAFKSIGIAIVGLITEGLGSYPIPELFVGLGLLLSFLWLYIGINSFIKSIVKK